MAKAYFNLPTLFDETDVDDGHVYDIYVETIEVGSAEQLTADYFTEVGATISDFSRATNPHTSNAWEFSNCSQFGSFPNPTYIDACALGGTPNSWNPFRHALKCNYTDTVNGVLRGQISSTISGNLYGVEQFGFGFDKVDVPINDATGGTNGSSGASVNGAFWLDIDYTQDFSMVIWITKFTSVGDIVYQKQVHIIHIAESCDFRLLVFDAVGTLISDSKQLGHLSGGLQGWVVPACSQSVVDCTPEILQTGTLPQPADNFYLTNAGNGSLYSFPIGPHFPKKFLKIDTVLNIVSQLPIVSDYWCYEQVLANNGKIYALNAGLNTERVLEFDPTTETATPINIGTGLELSPIKYWGPVAFGQYIYWGPSGNGGGPIMKFDTVTGTAITIPVPASSTAGYGTGVLASNDRIYWFPDDTWDGSLKDILVIEPLNSDNVYKVGAVPLQSTSATVEANGNLYGFPTRKQTSGPTVIVKIEPNPTGETVSTIDITTEYNTLPAILPFNDAVTGSDGLVYLAPYRADKTMIFDPVSETITFEFQETESQFFFNGALGDNDFIYWLRVLPVTSPPPTGDWVWGFDTPDCTQTSPTNPPTGTQFCDCIVTQSLGLLAVPPQTPVTLFENKKQCCFDSLVVGDLADAADYKNDINGFLLKRNFASETIDFTLLKNGGTANGGTDIPLTDDTYGKFYDFGSFTDYPDQLNYKAYQIQWRKVLQVEGEGAYQLKIDSNLITGGVVSYSIPFKLREYTPECVKETVRIQSIMNGYMRSTDINYKGLEWLDGLRFEGMFGNRQAEYEEERLIFNNRKSKQLRSELINTYNLKSMHLPSCMTDLILDYHNLSNKMLITDYNPINHKVYIQKEVILDSVNEIAYPVVANTAPLDINYKDYVQHYKKSNC